MVPAQIGRGTAAGRAPVLVFSLWCLICLSLAARLSPSMQQLEVQKHLRRLNKPPLKTIEVSSLSYFLPLKDALVFAFRSTLKIARK